MRYFVSFEDWLTVFRVRVLASAALVSARPTQVMDHDQACSLLVESSGPLAAWRPASRRVIRIWCASKRESSIRMRVLRFACAADMRRTGIRLEISRRTGDANACNCNQNVGSGKQPL